MSKRRSKTPATLAQREAAYSEPLVINFNYTNDEWADAWLPSVRIAFHMISVDWAELRQGMQKLVVSGAGPELLEGLALTKQHLGDLQNMIAHALDRAFVALELAGYSPDNPPPASPMN